MEYKKYIKAHNFMRFSHEDDDVVVEVTFFKISYWYFSGCYPNTYPSDLNSQITLLKDGVPAGKAEQSYRANGDSITIQPRFPALLAGKYTAILEGNLHTTKWWRETLELTGKMDNPLLIDPSHHKHA
ncbi:hypothetical protein ACDL62_10440 [Corynebacterium diphtheriae]|uniref:hypothetical protein n=1 Tax=Corynebacterium diphtheriae TaxID=1717 RepID=UPI0035306A64